MSSGLSEASFVIAQSQRCSICKGPVASAPVKESVSFTTSTANPTMCWFDITIFARGQMNHFNLHFKVANAEMLRQHGNTGERCGLFPLQHRAFGFVHIVCPRQNDSTLHVMRWLSAGDPTPPHLLLQEHSSYKLQFISLDNLPCHVTPYTPNGLLTGVRLDPKSFMPSVPDAEQQNRGTKRPLSSAFHAHHSEGASTATSGAPSTQQRKLLSPAAVFDDEEDVGKDVKGVSKTSDSLPTGTLVASCSLTCSPEIGKKNLRQKANEINVTLEALEYTLKFKVYAQSTIRRGNKSSRHNAFLFNLEEDLLLHLRVSNSISKKSLKWIEDKDEHFLALECGVEYILRTFSTKGKPSDIKVSHNLRGSPLVSWSDHLHPERSIVFSQTEAYPLTQQPTLVEWEHEPRIWNMSLNPQKNFHCTIMRHRTPLPRTIPKVLFVVQDRSIEAVIEQYDWRTRKSFLISVPRLFSVAKAAEATREGVNFSKDVDILVLDQYGRRLWRSLFTYEIGM